jgi:outer membrane protein assembly factor BamA
LFPGWNRRIELGNLAPLPPVPPRADLPLTLPNRRPVRALLAILACAAATFAPAARAAPPGETPGAQAAPPAAPPGETPGARALLLGEDQGFGTMTLALGDAPGGPLLGKPIRRVEVVTVGGRWATSPTVSSVRSGDPATAEAARRVLREVLGSGQIARANVEALPAEGGGVILRVNVLPRRLVAAVNVGGGVLDQAETLEATGLSVGGEVTAPQLADVPARARELYDRHGYPFATVRVDAADGAEAGKVTVAVEIVPGTPRTFRRRVFVIDPAADREVADLKYAYKVSAGARVDEPSLAEADRELAESLKQHGFFRAEVRHSVRPDGERAWLYVRITPGPRFVPSFDGNRAFDAGDLEQALNLEKSPDHRQGELEERLRTFYGTRGFLDAEVSMKEIGKPDEPVHYLAFTVRENQQVRVTRRVFPCLTGELSAADVQSEIGSFLEEDLPGADNFWPPDPRVVSELFGPTTGTGGRGAPADLQPLNTYVPATYDKALRHLRDFYHSKGYLNAVIGPVSVTRATCDRRSPAGRCLPVPPKVKPLAPCRVDALGLPLPAPPVPEELYCRPNPVRGVLCAPELTVQIPVALGPQTRLWDLAFEGNRALPGARLGKIAALPLGTPISSVELESARVRVLDAYRQEGFAYAEVRASADPSPDRTRARVRFQISEREKVLVTGFVVKGNVTTKERLILGRLALKVGEPYRQDWARRSEERIATLGTFSSVAVSLEDADVPARGKRVLIVVAEALPQYIETRPGFSTGEGARLGFEWGHKNLGGLAMSLALRLQLSYLFQFLILDPQALEQHFPGDEACAVKKNVPKLCSLLNRLGRRNSLSFTIPEIGLGPLVSLTIDAVDINDNPRDYGIWKLAFVPTFTYRPMRQLNVQLGLSTEYNDVSIFNRSTASTTQNLLRAPEGKTVAVAQRVSFTADYRDKPLNATSGFLFSSSIEHVNAVPVGDFDPTKTSTSHFLRLTGRVAYYLRLTKGGVAIAASVGAGFNGQLFHGSKTYPDRLFFMGGSDSLRAFLADSMVPQDLAGPLLTIHDANKQAAALAAIALRGGDAAINPRVELRVPITELWNAGVFLDTGNVWVDPAQIDFTLRYAAGAGVRVTTPVGPLALDYGINLLRRSWEDFGAFHFSIGLF